LRRERESQLLGDTASSANTEPSVCVKKRRRATERLAHSLEQQRNGEQPPSCILRSSILNNALIVIVRPHVDFYLICTVEGRTGVYLLIKLELN